MENVENTLKEIAVAFRHFADTLEELAVVPPVEHQQYTPEEDKIAQESYVNEEKLAKGLQEATDMAEETLAKTKPKRKRRTKAEMEAAKAEVESLKMAEAAHKENTQPQDEPSWDDIAPPPAEPGEGVELPKPMTFEQIVEKFLEVVNRKRIAKVDVFAVLQSFGATNLKELNAEQYQAVLDKLEAF